MSSPMSLTELSQFYHQFAELDEAGINYLAIIELIKKNQKNHNRFAHYDYISEHLKKNRPLSEAFRLLKFVPVYDIPMIKAAEESGRLVSVFKMLSKKYSQAHLSEKQFSSQLIKPYLIFIVSLFLPSFPKLFSNQITLSIYLRNALIPFGVVTLIALFIYTYWKSSYYEIDKARRLHQFFSYIPFLNKISEQVSYQKFSSALSLMIESGLDLFEALKQSALCSAEPNLRAACFKIIFQLNAGKSFGHINENENLLPLELKTALDLGAQSGKLPEFLNRYSENLDKEIDQKINILTKAIPTIIYWIVTLNVAYIIIQFYQGHLNEINQVLE